MAKWVVNFETPKVGDADLIKRFNEPSLLNDGQQVIYGVSDGDNIYHAKGQNNWNYRGLKLISHGGHVAAFRTFLGRFPDQSLAVIVLSNDEHYLNFDTSIKIAELYLKDYLKPNQILTTNANSNKSDEKPNNNLKDFEGKFYNDELETIYTAKVSDGKLFFSNNRFINIGMNEISKDKFSGRIDFPVEIEFLRNEKGEVIGFKVSNFGAKNVKFKKIMEK